jgi:hypothetical protein
MHFAAKNCIASHRVRNLKQYFLRFRVSFNFNLLDAFLAFSSLGAGSGKRTRKPLGAHQEKIFDCNEGEHSRFSICNRITNLL